MTSNWLTQLNYAVQSLEKSSAPLWLKSALREAVKAGPELAPREERQAEPPPFIYPH